MEELGVFLHAPDPATGDIPNLTAQMAESNVRTTTLVKLCLWVRAIVYAREMVGRSVGRSAVYSVWKVIGGVMLE